MRRIGTIPNPLDARRFCDYLITLQVHATAEPARDSDATGAALNEGPHEVWVRDENRLDQARELLDEFLADPGHARYEVSSKARDILRQEQAERVKRVAKVRKFNPGSGVAGFGGGMSNQRTPLTVSIIVLCVLVGLLTGFGNPRPAARADQTGRRTPSSELRIYDALMFYSRTDLARGQSPDDDPYVSIRKGQVWRVLTPALLHGGIGHLAMNMMGLLFLGGVFERLHGVRWLALALLFMAVTSMLVQVHWPPMNNGGPSAVGASGAIYGLFGFFLVRHHFDPLYPVQLPPMFQAVGIGFLLLGVLLILPNIANGSHVGGLASGMLLAAVVPSHTAPRRRA
jgi:GlpG protein